MGKPFGFTCSLSCLTLKAFSLFDCKLLMIKPHLTSTDLNRQFLIHTTSQLIEVGFLLSFTGSSSFKGLILYLKIPSNDLQNYRSPTFSYRLCVSTEMPHSFCLVNYLTLVSYWINTLLLCLFSGNKSVLFQSYFLAKNSLIFWMKN